MENVNYEYIINGETPAKKNSRITLRNGRTIPSKRYQEWHKQAIHELSQMRKPSAPIDYPVVITIWFIHGDLRRRDSDNGCSSVLDTLTDAGILLDDNFKIVKRLVIENDYQKNNAKVLINIHPVE